MTQGSSILASQNWWLMKRLATVTLRDLFSHIFAPSPVTIVIRRLVGLHPWCLGPLLPGRIPVQTREMVDPVSNKSMCFTQPANMLLWTCEGGLDWWACLYHCQHASQPVLYCPLNSWSAEMLLRGYAMLSLTGRESLDGCLLCCSGIEMDGHLYLDEVSFWWLFPIVAW